MTTKNINIFSNIHVTILLKKVKNTKFDIKYEADDNINMYNLILPSSVIYDKSINPIANIIMRKKMKKVFFLLVSLTSVSIDRLRILL